MQHAQVRIGAGTRRAAGEEPLARFGVVSDVQSLILC